jgi:hypothetical protein
VKGQGVRCEVESGGDRTGWHALRSRFDKQAEDIKAVILGERGQGRDDICLFHNSTIIELIQSPSSHISVVIEIKRQKSGSTRAVSHAPSLTERGQGR